MSLPRRTATAIAPPQGHAGSELLRRVRQVVDQVVAPNAERYDDEAAWPADSFRVCVEAGLVGLAVPVEHGGSGAPVAEQCLTIEELAWGCGATASCVQANWMPSWLLTAHGTEEQQARYLPGIAAGERQGSFAVTEAIGRHQPVAPTVAAVTGDGRWSVTGHKAFVGNGGVADFCIFAARTHLPDGSEPVACLFIADRDRPGFAVTRVVPKMSVRGYQTADYAFDDLEVRDADMLGGPGEGMRLAMSTIDVGRVVYAAQALGIAQRAIDELATYADHGRDEGRHLSQHQAIQFMAADAATATAAARLLTYRAAAAVDDAEPSAAASAAAAKYAASMAAKVAVDNALQVHGAYGLTEDAAVERLYRDQRVLEIGVGSNEAMKTVVARAVLKAGAPER